MRQFCNAFRTMWLALAATTVAAVFPAAQQPVDRQALAAQVRGEFQHAWSSYVKYASGHDELNPISRKPHDWYPPAVVYMTPVDSLDTMLLMGLTREANDTRQLLLDKLAFDKDVSVQVFEVTIRILGALVTAAQMTGEPRFLNLADDLASRLLPAFDSPTGMPYRFVNLKTGKTSGVESNPAEIGTLILEFGALAKLTNKPVYFDKTKRAMTELFARRAPATGLLGEGINVDTGAWTNTSSHVGGGIDSFYEYALKCERLFGDRECGAMARSSLASINRYLADDGPGGLWYGVSDMAYGRRTATTYGALHAFLPAVFALAGDLTRARRLQDSNFKMWTTFGIEPEELDYSTMTIVRPGYQLRPENVESAYYLFHYTKDPIYLEMGRQFLADLIKYCRTENGYTVLRSVASKEKGDRMHSFLLAETFKYLYLLFAPEVAVDLDRVVFNTEAHPLRRVW